VTATPTNTALKLETTTTVREGQWRKRKGGKAVDFAGSRPASATHRLQLKKLAVQLLLVRVVARLDHLGSLIVEDSALAAHGRARASKQHIACVRVPVLHRASSTKHQQLRLQ
jgi:hypothetical protein